MLSTATYGPFAASQYNGTATGTQTNAAGIYGSVALYGTATTGVAQSGAPSAPAGVSATGGFSVNQGDQIYIVRGTDASAITAFALEYAPTPLANVTQ